MLAVVSGLIFVNGLSRLFNKNSYSTHLTSKAMVVYDSWGRVVNRAAWEDIAEIFPRQSETILGLGAWFKSTLAWRCNTSPKPRGLFAYTRGGKTLWDSALTGFCQILTLVTKVYLNLLWSIVINTVARLANA